MKVKTTDVASVAMNAATGRRRMNMLYLDVGVRQVTLPPPGNRGLNRGDILSGRVES